LKGKIPVFNKVPRHEDVLEEWRYGSTPYLGTRWSWVVNFTPWSP